METKTWSRESSELKKDELIKELTQEPFKMSENNLELLSKELDNLINEEEVRQNNN